MTRERFERKFNAAVNAFAESGGEVGRLGFDMLNAQLLFEILEAAKPRDRVHGPSKDEVRERLDHHARVLKEAFKAETKEPTVTISRKQLEDAWNENEFLTLASTSGSFKRICKALSFPEEKE